MISISNKVFCFKNGILIFRKIENIDDYFMVIDFIGKNLKKIRGCHFSKYVKKFFVEAIEDYLCKLYLNVRGKVPAIFITTAHWIWSKLKILTIAIQPLREKGNRKLKQEVKDLHALAIQGYSPEDARTYIMRKYYIPKISTALVARIMRIAKREGIDKAYNYLINFLKWNAKEIRKRANYWYGKNPSKTRYIVNFYL